MRLLGAGASVLLVGALILAGIGLFGGPDTPFSVFRAPIASRHDDPGTTGHSASGQHGPGAAGGSQPPGSPTSPGRSPSPSHSAAPSSPAPSTSPAPTNSAGKTPPGLRRTKKPHPSPSPHAT
jgi:hypothetical protein